MRQTRYATLGHTYIPNFFTLLDPRMGEETGLTWETMAWCTTDTQKVFEQIESTCLKQECLPFSFLLASLEEKCWGSTHQPFLCFFRSWDNSCLGVSKAGKEVERKGEISFLILFYLPCLQLGSTDIWTDFKAFVFVNCSSLQTNLFLWPRSQAWARSQGEAIVASLGSVHLLMKGEVQLKAWGPR